MSNKSIFNYLLLGMSLLFTKASLYAQDTNNEPVSQCTEQLVKAQLLFDEGRIHEVPGALDLKSSCFHKKGVDVLSIEQKSTAYRLLVLTYLQLNNKEMADGMMFELLEVNPEYKLDKAIDPVEFENLYRTYRTKPIIKVALKGGTNATTFNYTARINVFDEARDIDYTLGSQFGISGEFDISNLRKKNTTDKDLLLFNPEIFYSTKKITHFYKDHSFISNRITEYSYGSLDVRLMVNYLIEKFSGERFQFHLSLGVSGDLIVNYTGQGIDGTPTAPGGNLEKSFLITLENYKKYQVGVIAGTSLRIKVGRPWLIMDLRYNYYVTDPLILDQTYSISSDITGSADFVLNPGFMQYLNANIGVSVPIFNHEKLKEFTTNE
ncbi:MAG: PorT family protein [Cyclobacteriaceae bacterium]|nr:PorT family protein [Cyclobacteriaceae bacterium]